MTDSRKKLFLKRDPYTRTAKAERDFISAVREQTVFHRSHCGEYARILDKYGFDAESIRTEADLRRLPPLPTLYFKRNRLFSVPEEKLAVKATSSGTKGSRSTVGFDRKTLLLGIGMMYRFFRYHRIISVLPVHYVVLGYEPSAHADMGAVKTAYGTTKFAPALSRRYCLRDNGTGYDLDIEGVCGEVVALSKKRCPTRFVGFPAYMYFAAKRLRERGERLHFGKRSMILLGGGWKQFAGEEIDREEFYNLIHDVLGIPRERVFEFYSAVEHPMAYVKCKNGHFHVPLYSRVIIRDVRTLEPVPDGTEGLLSFVFPLAGSMPLTSVVTDDIAVLSHENCGCGLDAPYFDLKGRAGVSGIKTCAATAVELAGGEAK